MATEDFKRKLTAILSADFKGYSRLMGEDEETTVRTITTYREVITFRWAVMVRTVASSSSPMRRL